MRRGPSYLYMNEDKPLIITDPLFPPTIPLNPPQISWIRYSLHNIIFELSFQIFKMWRTFEKLLESSFV
jgi:hypothetical protein